MGSGALLQAGASSSRTESTAGRSAVATVELRQVGEGVLDDLGAGGPAGGVERDGHDQEAPGGGRAIVACQPGARATQQRVELEARDGGRGLHLARLSRAHLDEGQARVVAAHDVQLAAAHAEVALDDGEAGAGQRVARGSLRDAAAGVRASRHQDLPGSPPASSPCAVTTWAMAERSTRTRVFPSSKRTVSSSSLMAATVAYIPLLSRILSFFLRAASMAAFFFLALRSGQMATNQKMPRTTSIMIIGLKGLAGGAASWSSNGIGRSVLVMGRPHPTRARHPRTTRPARYHRRPWIPAPACSWPFRA